MSLPGKRFELEVLEQRILLSADSLPVPDEGLEEAAIIETDPILESEGNDSEAENGTDDSIFAVETTPLQDPDEAEAIANPEDKDSVEHESISPVPLHEPEPSHPDSDGVVSTTEQIVETLKAGQGPPVPVQGIVQFLSPGQAFGDATLLQEEPTVPRPMLIVPGIAGTFAAPGAEEAWYTERGIAPELLEIDPLAGFYDDILATFEEAAGYVPGETLFAAVYDWRMAPGPLDGAYDGVVNGLTVESLTDDVYEFSVDYLGYWMELAVNQWTELYGESPDGVDLVTHSTGGLVARTYIQSTAYAESAGDINLPVVQNLVMVGVPNRGAPKAWNPLFNDFSADPAFQIVLSKVIFNAYERYLEGEVIEGADGNISLVDRPGLSEEAFILAYVPTIRGLLATYGFLYPEDALTKTDANETAFRNDWVLDLNDGLDLDYSIIDYRDGNVPNRDPHRFADRVVNGSYIVYSDGTFTLPDGYSGEVPEVLGTIVEARTFTGRQDPADVVANFDEFYGHEPAADETWYRVLPSPGSGDGTVPTASAVRQFELDPLNADETRFSLLHVTEPTINADGNAVPESIGHTGLMGNRQMQAELMNFLGLSYDPTKISTDKANPWYETLATVIGLQILDPSALLEAADWTELTEFGINLGIRQGLNVASEWFGAIDEQVIDELVGEGIITPELNPLQWPVPFTSDSLGKLLSFRNFFNTFIAFPIIDYMENTPNGGTEALVEALKGLGDVVPDTIADGAEYTFTVLQDAVKGGVVLLQDPRVRELLQLDLVQAEAEPINEAVFYVPFEYVRVSQAPLDLGPLATLQGLQIDPTATVEYTAGMTGSLVFGYDMREGVPDDERFFIRFNELEVSASANANDLSAALNVGVLGATVTNGFFNAEAGLRFGFAPGVKDSRGNVTQRQLAGNTGVFDGFLALNPGDGPYANLDASLPLSVDYPGLEDLLAPVINLSGTDLFNGVPEIDLQGFSKLQDFTTLSLEDLESGLYSLFSILQQSGAASALQADIPFASDLPLASLIPLGDVLEESLLNKLRTEEGDRTYSNLQEFVALVDSTLSTAQNLSFASVGAAPLNTTGTNGRYDDAGKALGFSFDYGFTVSTGEKPLDFDYNLDPLEILFTGGSFTLDATGALSFDLSYDLSPPTASLTADVPLPVDGILGGPVYLEVLLNAGILSFGEAVHIEILPDPANASAEDLVGDINAALSDTILAGLVQARLDSGLLVLGTVYSGPHPFISVRNGEALGFVQTTRDFSRITARTSVANLSAELSATFTVTHFTASANIGYAGIFISEGSADLALDFLVDLTPAGPVALEQFLYTLFTETESYLPDISLTASGFVLLQGIQTEAGFLEDPPTERSIQIGFSETITFPLSATDPSQFTVTFNGDFTDLLKFQALSFPDMMQLIRGGTSFIGDLVQYDFLNTDIPFLGGSVNDLLNLVDVFTAFLGELEESAPSSIQAFSFFLNLKLQELLDTAFPGQGLIADANIQFGSDDVLRIDFSYRTEKTISKRFELDLGGELGLANRIVDLESNSLLETSLAVWMQVSMGIDLSNPNTPSVYLYSGTQAVFEILLAAENINFAAAAPLGIFIKGGSVNIDDGTPTRNPARVSFAFNPAGVSRLPIGSFGLEAFDAALIGEARARLPVCFPVDAPGNLLDPPIEFNFDFRSPGTPSITGPDFGSLFESVNLFDAIGTGLDLLFIAFGEVADGNLFGFDLPFIGGQLGEIADFATDLRNVLKPVFDELETFTEEAIQLALFEVLGPGIDGNGLDYVLPILGAGIPDTDRLVSSNDIRVDLGGVQGSIDSIEIEVRLGEIIRAIDFAMDFDDGLPGIDLDFDIGLLVELSWEWRLIFGVNRTDGFYLRTAQGNDLSMRLDVRLPPDTRVGGTLGFMTLLAYEQPGGPLTGLDLDLGVDLNPSGGLLTLGELTQLGDFGNYNVSLDGQAVMDLVFVLGFSDFSGEPIEALPSFVMDFDLDWDLFDSSVVGSEPIGSLPSVSFGNIRLDVGTFFGDFLRPIVEAIDGYVKPFDPIIEFLTMNLNPYLGWQADMRDAFDRDNDGDNIVTILDIADLFGILSPSTQWFIDAVISIRNIIGLIDSGSLPSAGTLVTGSSGFEWSGVTIGMGAFDFGNIDLRSQNALFLDPSLNGNLSGPSIDIGSAFADLGGNAAETYSLTQIGFSTETTDGQFSFEILDPANVIKLILGQTVEFFSYTLPELNLNASVKTSIPIWPFPLVTVRFGVVFGVRANLAFGYDSSGIDAFRQSGDADDLFGGFYIEVGSQVPPLLYMYGGVTAGVYVDIFLVAEGKFEIGLILGGSFSLVDPGNGKLYLWQISALVESKGLVDALDCLILKEGEIYVYADVGVTIFDYGSLNYELGRRTLFEFGGGESDCFVAPDDDRLEQHANGLPNNDTIQFAADIGVAPGIHLRDASISRPGDVDYYAFELLKPDSLEVELAGPQEYEISLLTAAGLILRSASAGTERKRFETPVLPPGTYYIRIGSTSTTVHEKYALDIEPSESSQTRVLYVSNISSAIDRHKHHFYTTSGGSVGGERVGLDPDRPAATLDVLLQNYELTPNDLILFDTGVYELNTSLSSAYAGLVISGAPDDAYRDLGEEIPLGSELRGSGSETTLSIDGVDGMTLAHFRFTSNALGLDLKNSAAFRGMGLSFESVGTGARLDNANEAVFEQSSFRGTEDDEFIGLVVANSLNFSLDEADFEKLQGGVELVNVQGAILTEIDAREVDYFLDVEGSSGVMLKNALLEGGEFRQVFENSVYVGSGEVAVWIRNGDGIDLQSVVTNRYRTGFLITDTDNANVISASTVETETGLRARGVSTLSINFSDLRGSTYGLQIGDPVIPTQSSLIEINGGSIGGPVLGDSDSGPVGSNAWVANALGFKVTGSSLYGNLSVHNSADVTWASGQVQNGSLSFSRSTNVIVRDTLIDGDTGEDSVRVSMEDVDGATISGNEINAFGDGIDLERSSFVNVLTNTINNSATGIRILGVAGDLAADILVEGNQLTSGKNGIVVANTEVSGITISANQASLFSNIGIHAVGYAELHDNIVWQSFQGIRFEPDVPGMWGNVVRENIVGLTGGGFLGNEDYSGERFNIVFNNGLGIAGTGDQTVSFNRVFGNATGVSVESGTLLHHNLIFKNESVDVRLDDAAGSSVWNNTIYSTGTHGIHLSNGTVDTDIRNNIVWSEGGTALTIDPGSGGGLSSDYNNYFISGGGVLFNWHKPINDLFDWQVETGMDTHSIGTTRLDPSTDRPAFIDAHNGDYRIVDRTSTTINAGDPSFAYENEPGPGGGVNGLAINLGVYGNTAQAALSPDAYIRMITPEFFTDFTTDVARQIAWQSFNLAGTVRIELFESGVGKVADIATLDILNLPEQLTEQPVAQGSTFWSPQMSGIAGSHTKRYYVKVSLVDDASVQDRSREDFAISGPTDTYYVNDSLDPDDVTESLGDNRNTGKSSFHPKAVVFGILDNYTLAAGDTLLVDNGHYIHLRDVRIDSFDEAFVLTGPALDSTEVILDRRAPRPGTRGVLLEDASFVTIRDIVIEGAYHGVEARNGSTFLTLNDVEVRGSVSNQIYLHSGADRAVLDGVHVHGGEGSGIVIDAILDSIRNSVVEGNAGWGLQLTDTADAEISANRIAGNQGGGLYLNNTVPESLTVLGFEDLEQGRGNIFHDNLGRQVQTHRNALVVGNTVFHTVATPHMGTGVGIFTTGETVRYNIVTGHGTGIYSGEGSVIEQNRIYNNTVRGVWLSNQSQETVHANVIYSSPVGIEVEGPFFGGAANGPTITNNLIYDTSTAGLRMTRADGFTFLNNTVYPESRDALIIRDSENGDIRNNIFRASTGSAIDVDLASEVQLTSDYNLFAESEFGFVGIWAEGSRADLSDWQTVSFQDANSLQTNPRFVSPAGADGVMGFASLVNDGRDDNFHLQSTAGSVRNGSLAPVLNLGTGLAEWLVASWEIDSTYAPGIDRGDGSSPFDQEPAPNGNFVNMGAFGNTPLASHSLSSYVLVTAPGGGETWPMGQTFMIEWRSHDNAGTVDILLKKSGVDVTLETIATATANDGTFEWQVPETLSAGSSYVIEIVRSGLGGASGQSPLPFSISDPISRYYVDALGDDTNDGLSAETAKASILAVLEAYDMEPGDVIIVAPGEYTLTTNITIGAEDSGVTIRGHHDPSNPDIVSRLNRGGYELTDFIFEFEGARDVTLEHLWLENAWRGIDAPSGTATNLAIRNSTFSLIQEAGIYVETDNPGLLVEGSYFEGSNGGYKTGQMQYGIFFRGVEGIVRGNTFLNSRESAIFLRPPASETSKLLVEGNRTSGGQFGVRFIGQNTPTNAIIRENIATGASSYGIYVGGAGVVATANVAYGNPTGMYIWYGAAAIGNVEIRDNDTGIELNGSGRLIGNTSFNNLEGIKVSGNSDLGLVEGNSVYENVTGIRFDGWTDVVGNRVHDNVEGLRSDGAWKGQIANNLVFDNADYAVRINGAARTGAHDIINNTFVQTGSMIPAVTLSSSPAIHLLNNILVIEEGSGLSIDETSQSDFSSDYNLFSFSGSPVWFDWSGLEIASHADWFYTVGADRHSLFTDPLFVNPAGGDYHLQPGSPAIDAGDPGTDFIREPIPSGDRVNLGAYGNTPEAESSSGRSITFLDPTSLDKLVQNEPYRIRFLTSGFLDQQVASTRNLGMNTLGEWELLDDVTGGSAIPGFGNVDTSGVVNPAPEEVYVEHWRSGYGIGERIEFELEMTAAEYLLRLHFADFSNTSSFTFDIFVEGERVRQDFNIFTEAGGTRLAHVVELPVTADGEGPVQVSLVSTSAGYASISAIEVVRLNPEGSENPSFAMEASFDNGNTFSKLVQGIILDRRGVGYLDWAPRVDTDTASAMVRVTHQAFNPVQTVSPAFQIVNDGHEYFINDVLTESDRFTKAAGDNRNSGKDEYYPMASLEALLTVYDPGAGDIIYIDSGTYTLRRNIVLDEANSGLTIRGISGLLGNGTVLDRANRTTASVVFELNGAEHVTLENLALRNAYNGVWVPEGRGSHLTVRNSLLQNHENAGLYVEALNPGLLIEGSIIEGSGSTTNGEGRQIYGLYYAGTQLTVRDSIIRNNYAHGIYLFPASQDPAMSYVLESVRLDLNPTGISTNAFVDGLRISDSAISGSSNTGAVLTGVRTTISTTEVSSNARGLYLAHGASAIGNEIYDNDGIGIELAASSEALDNSIFANNEGIRATAGNNLISGNAIYQNTTGVHSDALSEIRGNKIHENTAGLYMDGFLSTQSGGYGLITNNLIVDNLDYALRLNRNLGQIDVVNNTIAQSGAGKSAVLVENAPNVAFYNNIFSLIASSGLNVNGDSQNGLVADYNLHFFRDGAVPFIWSGSGITDLTEWFYSSGNGAHSLFEDPLFRAASRGDYRLQSGSPAIDVGSPYMVTANELEPLWNRVDLGAYGNTREAEPSDGPSVHVIDPVQYDKLQLNRESTIRFLASGVRAEQTVVNYNFGNDRIGDWLLFPEGTGGSIESIRSGSANVDLSGVGDPAPEEVYLKALTSSRGEGERIDIPLTLQPGTYVFKLHFVEYFDAPEYTFDIEVDGTVVRENYSIINETGAINTAVTEKLGVTVGESGKVVISLVVANGLARIAGMEVLHFNPDGEADPRFRIEASYNGGSSFIPVASGVSVDSRGIGEIQWTPIASTPGRTAMIRVSSEADATISGRSELFVIANDGSEYFINDDSVAGDQHTSATGNNLNSGKYPSEPMASLEALLNVYELSAGDVVYVDAGIYQISRNLRLTAAHSGIIIKGAIDSQSGEALTIMDRGNTSTNSSVVELDGVTDIRLEGLRLTGGYTGIHIIRDSGASNIELVKVEVVENTKYGLNMEGGNGSILIEDSLFRGSGVFNQSDTQDIAIYTDSPDLIIRQTVFSNYFTQGLIIDNRSGSPTESVLIENSLFEGGNGGIRALVDNVIIRHSEFKNINGTAVQVQGANSRIESSVFHNSGSDLFSIKQPAIYAYNDTRVVNNEVFDNVIGIRVINGAIASSNTVYGNVQGIVVEDAIAEQNRVYANTEFGIQGHKASRIEGNKVYSNETGIEGYGYSSFGTVVPFTGSILNNIVFANGSIGIDLVYGREGALITNNTVYQPTGDALRLRNSTAGRIYNNILGIDAGFALNVDTLSTDEAVLSDYNLFVLGAELTARIADISGTPVASLGEWTITTGKDANSLVGDPGFFDLDGADDVWGYQEIDGTGIDGGLDDNFHLLKSSPAIDRGISWWAPSIDAEGDSRSDDPGTENLGGDRYQITVLGENLFDPARGIAQGWTSTSNVYTLDLPFEFEFYGRSYSRIEVSTAGMIGLPRTFGNSVNSSEEILVSRSMLTALWGNLDTSRSGHDIYVDTSVAGEVYIRYEARSRLDSSTVRFAILLQENGSLRFDYGQGNKDLSPVVGLSLGNGIDYTLIDGYNGSQDLNEASSVMIDPVPGIHDLGAYEFKGSTLDSTPPTAVGTFPAEIDDGGNITGLVDEIEIQLSEDIDSIDATSPDTFVLIRDSNEDGAFDELDESYTVLPSLGGSGSQLGLFSAFVGTTSDLTAFAHSGSDTISLSITDGNLPDGQYQLRIKASNLRDVSGNSLDGDGTGSAGNDYVVNFSIDQPLVSELTSDTDVEAVKGEAFSYQLTATGNPISYSIEGLPSGLSFNQETGLVSGIPQVAGEFELVVGIANADWTSQDVIQMTILAAPQITSALINDGQAQRSTLRRVELSLDAVLSTGITAADIELVNLTDSREVAPEDMLLTWSFASRKLVLTFPALPGGSLPDGDYRLRIPAEAIIVDGLLLDGDNDGAQGGDYLLRFHRLLGDVAGDGGVDMLDGYNFRRAYASSGGDANYREEFDFNQDGNVNDADLDAFAANYLVVYTDFIASQESLTGFGLSTTHVPGTWGLEWSFSEITLYDIDEPEDEEPSYRLVPRISSVNLLPRINK